MPQTNSGLMRPAIDHKGRIWFGEMGHNYLAMFDPRAHKFQQMTPPRGAAGIMGISVAADDTIWFAEQYANYIGHYVPATGQYQTYDLPKLTVPDPSNKNSTLTLPSAPNDTALDAQGNVWFTELNADSIGMLDVHRGQFKYYPLTPTKSVQKLNPYGITVDRHGIVWFTEASSSQIGRLDPATGAIRFFAAQNNHNTLMEITSDAQGNIWATAFDDYLLLKFAPATEQFTAYTAPHATSGSGALYGVLAAQDGAIWVTVTAENVIARLDVATGRFAYYSVPTKDSSPLGIVMGSDHTLWFTEASSDKIGMLQP
ncbi:MAG TPA: hypothetical protein VFU49_16005 [Ktedonobacteraceae bacterium]|nr:hypothetical protein [Ktedonobacteraceae bacterium]